MSSYNLDLRVAPTENGYAVTCFDGSVGRVQTDGPDGVVLVFEDGSAERHETADMAIHSLIGAPQ